MSLNDCGRCQENDEIDGTSWTNKIFVIYLIQRLVFWIRIKMPEDDFDKSFSTLISKLGHPVEEIRLRALENLQAKLDLKLVADVDILQYKYLYIKLLEWFNFPSPPKRDAVLDIVLKLSKV
ncbi:unnamed protein product [Adineta steineri]|uniref:Rotatin N-terminal domain-containing protein n=1 Tax=Adineta steineri TaxID=433720 RepID=A0A813UGE5_9BILA|nr:unnamed protein product [Adineta steineri]